MNSTVPERNTEEKGIPRLHRVPQYVWVTIGITLLTPLLHVIGMSSDLVNVSLIYLFPILVSAVYWGLGPAIYAASLSVIMFDFFLCLRISVLPLRICDIFFPLLCIWP